MISHWHLREKWHPSENELFLYLNGELSPRAAEKVRTHLEGCWSCGVANDKIKNAVAAFIEYRDAALEPWTKPPAEAQRLFEARLNRVAAQTDDERVFSFSLESSAWRSRHPIFSVGLVTFLLASVLVVILFLRLSSVPMVSAAELLHRTQAAETQRIQQVTRPVVHQKIRVRKRSGALKPEWPVTWEMWRDESSNRVSQQVEDPNGLPRVPLTGGWGPQHDPALSSPVLSELRQILQANHMDALRPLSPASYQSWRQSIQPKSQQVIETRLPDGAKALALTTTAAGPFAVNAAVKAELVIRTEDWHPVEQRLWVQKEGGLVDFELTEVAYNVLAFNALPPLLLADLAPPASPIPLPRLATPPRALSPAFSEADVVAAEVEVLFALHRLGACLGQPIEVVRDDGRQIKVQGLAETVEQREEIVEALRGIPFVKIGIRTPEDDRMEAAASTSGVQEDAEVPDASSPEPAAPLRARISNLPIQDLLERYFAEEPGSTSPQYENDPATVKARIAELSRKVIADSESAWDEGWALRRLAEWDRTLGPKQLRYSSQALVELMVRDHMNALRAKLEGTRNLVEPILSRFLAEKSALAEGKQLEPPETQDGESTDWTEGSFRLFVTVEEAAHLTLALFADTNVQVGSREDAMRQLLADFSRLERKFQDLDHQVARRFSEEGERAESVPTLPNDQH